MGFENFGVVSFASESKADAFLTYLEQGKVMATRCKKCGARHFPPKADCPACLSSEVEWVPIDGSGTLVTYTAVSYGPTGFENNCPYTLGIVEFADKLKVFGAISPEVKAAQIQAGMKLKAQSVKLANSRLSYEFIDI